MSYYATSLMTLVLCRAYIGALGARTRLISWTFEVTGKVLSGRVHIIVGRIIARHSLPLSSSRPLSAKAILTLNRKQSFDYNRC